MNIYVCVDGGIVNEVYVEKDRSAPEPEVVVLDVDSDYNNTRAIQDEWDRIAADPAYAPAGVTFLDPLGEG